MSKFTRRGFLKGLGAASAAWMVRGKREQEEKPDTLISPVASSTKRTIPPDTYWREDEMLYFAKNDLY